MSTMNQFEKANRQRKAALLSAAALRVAGGKAADAHHWLSARATDRDWENLAAFIKVNVPSTKTRTVVLETLLAASEAA